MLFVWVGWGGVGAITFRCTCTQQSCYANSQTTFLLYDAIVTTCLLYLQIQMMLRQGGRVGWGVRKRSVCCTCTQKWCYTNDSSLVLADSDDATRAKTVSANRAASQTTWVSQQEGASQPTGGRESANRKARVSQQEGASQPTGRCESANQGGGSQTTRTTRSRVGQPVASQPARSRVSQPGHKSANQVASQTTGRESANRSQVSQPGRESTNINQPGRESDNQDARRTWKETKWNEGGPWEDMKGNEHMKLLSGARRHIDEWPCDLGR